MIQSETPSDQHFSATLTCPADHAVSFRKICKKLDGKVEERPDGSLSCTIWTSSGHASQDDPRTFDVVQEDVETAELISAQLGGRLTRTKSGATCAFVLPPEPRWSIQPLSRTTANVRFDLDTCFTVSWLPEGLSLRTIQCGQEIEAIDVTHSSAIDQFSVLVTVDKTTTELSAHLTESRITLGFKANDAPVFELSRALTGIQRDTVATLSQKAEARVTAPYLSLFLTEIRENPDFNRQIDPYFGPNRTVLFGTVEYFCAAACAACIAGSTHGCTACAFCLNRFTSEPAPIG